MWKSYSPFTKYDQVSAVLTVSRDGFVPSMTPSFSTLVTTGQQLC